MTSNATCPRCKTEVILTAVENPRNNKWTIVPLDSRTYEPGDFTVDFENYHPTVDIMGEDAGDYPIATYVPAEGTHRTHSPSHYLALDHDG